MQGNSQLVLVQPLSLEPPKPQYGGDATDALFEELAKRVDKKLAAQARQGGQKHKKAEESSSDDEFHPPDPQHCNVQGPGFAGGHAGAPVKLVVHVKDERGKRIKEGGEEVTVRVRPPVGVGHVSVEVTDNNDGTYTAIYTPPIKGNYSLTVEVNGMSLAGSPFPVFFSSPLDPAQLAAEEAAERAAASTPTPLPPPPLLGAPSGGASWMSDPAAQMVSNAAAAGTAAAAAISDEHLRTLYISNISPAIPFDRLHELFSIFGNVIDLRPLGDSKDMAVVLFSNKEAQSQGQQLNNTMFGDRPLSVTAPITAMAAGVVPANPALAMQMQQIQQMQAAMAATQKLAIQVASMRAFAKSGQAMPREDPTRAADAVARLNKKFGAGGGAPGGIGAALVAAAAAAAAAAQANANSAQDEARAARAAQDKRVSRSRSRSGSPRRRRSRSRDGHDRRGGRDGRREADRRDREARERREREEREWERAREREREREKEMHRERALAKERERDRDRARERDRDRERRDKERKRSRSRSGDRKRSSRADDKDRGKERDREKDRGRDKEKEREKDRGRKEVPKKESSKHRAESPSARPKALAARSESPDASPSRADAAPSKPSKAEATPSKPSKAEAQEAQGALGSSPPAAVHADPPTKDAEEGGAPQAGKAVHEPSPAAHEPSPGAPSLSSVPTASVAAVVKAAGGDGEKKGGRHRERSYRRRSHSPS